MTGALLSFVVLCAAPRCLRRDARQVVPLIGESTKERKIKMGNLSCRPRTYLTKVKHDAAGLALTTSPPLPPPPRGDAAGSGPARPHAASGATR